jgi:hypothetical protein
LRSQAAALSGWAIFTAFRTFLFTRAKGLFLFGREKGLLIAISNLCQNVGYLSADIGHECIQNKNAAIAKSIFRHAPTWTSAADLKFLPRLPQTRIGTSNRKAALES